MLFTMALFVFFAAIVLVFSEEFLEFFKKIFEIPGATLIIPLTLASFLVYFIEDQWSVLMTYYLNHVQSALLFINRGLSKLWGGTLVAAVIFLTLTAIVPVFILEKIMHKKYYKPYAYPYLTSTLIWIINVFFLFLIFFH